VSFISLDLFCKKPKHVGVDHRRLIDENGKDITALDATGELLVRGPTIISGYYDNPTANAVSFDNEGYFRTGDIVSAGNGSGGTLETTKWYIVDRKKELIKVRGFQVSPAELEAAILQHPEIVDAAVIGVKLEDARDGECPRAYVVRRSLEGSRSYQVTESDVVEWCKQRLAKYKMLSGGVCFVDVLPRNASGKLLKRVLRELAVKELKGRSAKL
jgi:acyl-CoA synthetase (AMP-forming)/AMP-acid ligase II